MAMVRYSGAYAALDETMLERWRKVPPAVAGDCMNRMNVMAGRIKPVNPEMRVVAQARTLSAMVGDNSGIHAILPLMRAGEILVVDAGGYEDTAIIGDIVAAEAHYLGVAGFVIDGAVRDVAELRSGPVPVFAAAMTPAGPHKGFGGTIDGQISCGGVSVKPGDIVLGDADGVTVVPLEMADAVLAASEAHVKKEETMLAEIAKGKTTAEMLGVPVPEVNAE